jgi:hypothetical protein
MHERTIALARVLRVARGENLAAFAWRCSVPNDRLGRAERLLIRLSDEDAQRVAAALGLPEHVPGRDLFVPTPMPIEIVSALRAWTLRCGGSA